MAPHLQEESEASTRCSTPISKTHFFPEPAETPTRICTPVSNAHLPEESETTTRSCTPVSKTLHISEKSGTPTQILKSPNNSFECHTPIIQTDNIGVMTPPAAEKKSLTSSSKLLLLAEKQKQVSPAFGNHLIWPSDSPIKKPKKERLPFATTSKKWQDYWLWKENEKDEQNRKTENVYEKKRKSIKVNKYLKKHKKEIKGEMTTKITNKKKEKSPNHYKQYQ